jgi:hypothetical protein
MNKNFFGDYCKKIEPIVLNLMQKELKPYKHIPTIFSPETPAFIERAKVANEVRQLNMREGMLVQQLIGN